MNYLSYPYSVLNMQYRMHPAISSLSNRLFYRGGIEDAPSTYSNPAESVDPTDPIQPAGSKAGGYQDMRLFLERALLGQMGRAKAGEAWHMPLSLLSHYQFVNLPGEEHS